MTNNTINNVPFELLETLIEQHITAHGFTNHTARQAQLILCAPSPADLNGLPVASYLIGGEPSLTPCRVRGVVNEPLCRLSGATAIIDGLRGEVGAQRVKTCTALKERNDARTERDQHARRIGELEGLLLRVQVSLSLDDTEWGYSGAEKYKLLADIRSALSDGKEGE